MVDLHTICIRFAYDLPDTVQTQPVNVKAAEEGAMAIALWDHNAVEDEELSLTTCDVVHVLDFSDPHWWWAARGPVYGWVPSSYVQVRRLIVFFFFCSSERFHLDSSRRKLERVSI